MNLSRTPLWNCGQVGRVIILVTSPQTLILYEANATGVYGGYSGASNAIKTETFLRGGYATDATGVVEITTIYPVRFETFRTLNYSDHSL